VAYLVCITGQLEQANRLVSAIRARFIRPDGDFRISATQKSGQVDYSEKVWGYANAWARKYFDFAAACRGVYASHFSHKVAWGAAILYKLTGERRYADFARRIADLLVDLQHPGGAWFHGTPPWIAYDQSAECVAWPRQISAEFCDRS